MCQIDKRLQSDFMDAYLIVNSYVPKNMGTELEKVYVSSRMTRALGVCKRKQSVFGDAIPKSEIGISSRLLEKNYPKDYRVGTLIHEILHAYFPKDHHGGDWKKYAQVISKYTQYDIQRLATEEETGALNKGDAKYMCRCSKCGQIFEYNRASKVVKMPELFTHKKCGGTLERIK